ncbi:MAG: PAS domain S-box protein [Parvularcula sp.]|jgi:PAS domain S-box-containing protein|nr:PAS domain S-box protein [Parvularcula sp.]
MSRDPMPEMPPEAVLRSMFAQSAMALVTTDPRQDGNPIIYANPAFERLTGYHAAEAVGQNMDLLLGPDTDPDTARKLQEAVRDGLLAEFEILHYRRDGTTFWDALRMAPVHDENGELTHFIGSLWDVTDRHQTISALTGRGHVSNQAMQSAIDRARALEFALDQAKDSVMMTEFHPIEEPGPRIIWVSKGFEVMTGYTSEEVIGRTPRFLQGPATDRAVLDELRRSLASGEGHEKVRTINYRKDGQPFWIEWSVSPIHNTDGTPTAWLAVQRDVTDQVRQQEERERLLAELDHRVRNLFSTVQVIIRGAEDGDGSSEGLRRRVLYQLQALSSAHDLVFRNPERQASITEIVPAVLAPFDPDASLISREGGSVILDPKQSVNAAIILYELSVLSSERGALSKNAEVALSWELEDDELRITWREAGRPPEPSRFGFSLVKTFVRASSWDDAGIDENEDGFIVRLSLAAK